MSAAFEWPVAGAHPGGLGGDPPGGRLLRRRIGDSLSDADLFAAVPVSVGVNADRHLSGLATHSYMGGDLWEVYELVRHAR